MSYSFHIIPYTVIMGVIAYVWEILNTPVNQNYVWDSNNSLHVFYQQACFVMAWLMQSRLKITNVIFVKLFRTRQISCIHFCKT